MSVLSPNYRRLQNASVNDQSLVQGYKYAFKNGDIDGAHQLLDTNSPLPMNAKRLNDLVDTINYMQQFWANDKATFTEWLMGMMAEVEVYDPTKIYNVGATTMYNNLPYFCIEMGVTGAFEESKWLLLVPNSLGVNIKGEFDTTTTYALNDVTYLVNNNFIQWQCYDGNDWNDVGITLPNIRFLSNELDAYDGEIYFIEYRGGGA